MITWTDAAGASTAPARGAILVDRATGGRWLVTAVRDYPGCPAYVCTWAGKERAGIVVYANELHLFTIEETR